MFCTNCGKEIEDNSVFCPSCGRRIERTAGKNHRAQNALVCLLVIFPFLGVLAFFSGKKVGSITNSTIEKDSYGSTSNASGQAVQSSTLKESPYIPPMKGYLMEGYSIAIYEGTVNKGSSLEVLIDKAYNSFSSCDEYRIRNVEKLTHDYELLIREALWEYDFSKDEVYTVFVEPQNLFRKNEKHGACFCVKIEENKSKLDYDLLSRKVVFSYYGFFYDTK